MIKFKNLAMAMPIFLLGTSLAFAASTTQPVTGAKSGAPILVSPTQNQVKDSLYGPSQTMLFPPTVPSVVSPSMPSVSPASTTGDVRVGPQLTPPPQAATVATGRHHNTYKYTRGR